VTPTPNPFSICAQQKIDNVFGAEAFTGARYARENFLRGYRRISQTFDFIQTDIASLAVRPGVFLSKVFRELAVATVYAGAQAAHMIE
jgi:hypothetical protein